MPPLIVDGVVHPDEYEVRVDNATHPVTAHPAGVPIFVEIYYSFDGANLHFGIRRTLPGYRIGGISVWIDADCNGCEIGDLLLAIEPEHRLTAYGIFENPGQASQIAGTPPDLGRAGVNLRSFADGDTEIQLNLARQYANGLTPNPLPSQIHVNVTVKATAPDGRMVVNYLKEIPVETFVIAFE